MPSTSACTKKENDCDLNQWLPHVPIGYPDSMMSVESVRRAAEDFVTRPSDIIVATFAKTGTTLVTFIAHLLRTGADATTCLDFDYFCDVVPWPLLSWDIGVDPNTATPPHLHPRIFKSHLRLASIYRGAKYVVTIRDPAAVARSFYRFLRAKQVPQVLSMDLNTFICDTHFLGGHSGRASLWEYYAEYHAVLTCPSVLILVYEDLADDGEAADTKRTCLQQMAQFMEITAPDDDNGNDAMLDRTLAMSTREAMAALNHKFDEPYERACQLQRAADLYQLAPGAKVAVPMDDDPAATKLNARSISFLQQQWDQHLAPLGYKDYTSFAAAVRHCNRTRFKTCS